MPVFAFAKKQTKKDVGVCDMDTNCFAAFFGIFRGHSNKMVDSKYSPLYSKQNVVLDAASVFSDE